MAFFHFLRQALACVSKMYKGGCLWFLIFPSISSSMFTIGIGISIPERIKVIKSEHCIFMFMPVDVPCVSREDITKIYAAKCLSGWKLLCFSNKNVALGLRYSCHLFKGVCLNKPRN